jgi:hypothetical protein
MLAADMQSRSLFEWHNYSTSCPLRRATMGQEDATPGPGVPARGAIGWQASPSACAVISPPEGASSRQHTPALL